MDSDGNSNGMEHGGTASAQSVPLVTVTFDPRTCQCSIGGKAPSTFFAKYMLLMALESIELRLQNERAAQIAIPDGPMRGPIIVRG